MAFVNVVLSLEAEIPSRYYGKIVGKEQSDSKIYMLPNGAQRSQLPDQRAVGEVGGKLRPR